MAAVGCKAQNNAASASPGLIEPGHKLSPEMSRRIEVLIRSKSQMSPDYTINIGEPQKSDLNGYVQFPVTFSANGNTSHELMFYLSQDGKTLGQFNKFDVGQDPKLKVSGAGRPARGGPENAPVQIVSFDDLECPFCARMHAELFPALLKRYGDKVRIVYRDFPLDQHPWAMRAAVDVNCLGDQSTPGYWNLVDYIHTHASDIGADPKDPKAEKTMPRANEQLDKLTREQGQFQKADMPKLEACLTKQDTAPIEASKKIGNSLGIDSTPTLFINGDKIDGAVPLDFLFGEIDDALRAEGVQPPPPYVAPAPAAAPSATASGPAAPANAPAATAAPAAPAHK